MVSFKRAPSGSLRLLRSTYLLGRIIGRRARREFSRRKPHVFLLNSSTEENFMLNLRILRMDLDKRGISTDSMKQLQLCSYDREKRARFLMKFRNRQSNADISRDENVFTVVIDHNPLVTRLDLARKFRTFLDELKAIVDFDDLHDQTLRVAFRAFAANNFLMDYKWNFIRGTTYHGRVGG